MTDQAMLNMLQDEAVQCLLEEAFTHINSSMDEQYKALGKQNALLVRTTEIRYMHGGILYPPSIVKTIPYGSRIPTLHYSLISELETINKAIAQADYHYIKNFFVACISQSHNAIVLDSLLPVVLVNKLKQHFNTSLFKTLDTGVYGALQQEPISVTQENIQNIKEHYKATITIVQHMLMDKLLLQK